MNFTLDKSLEILERTPEVLRVLLQDLSDAWLQANEGADTWSPYDVMGHLIHGEKTDWIVRARLILAKEGNKTFEPFDRFAQFRDSQGKSLEDLLTEFQALRHQNLQDLRQFITDESQLSEQGIHPVFGEVTLHQLLASWVVHDLDHISQIVRVMAKHYREDAGPWVAFLKILRS